MEKGQKIFKNTQIRNESGKRQKTVQLINNQRNECKNNIFVLFKLANFFFKANTLQHHGHGEMGTHKTTCLWIHFFNLFESIWQYIPS